MADRFLDKVYSARTPEETRAVYDAWAKSYEAEIVENGYATPARCAKALMAQMKRGDLPVLDFGCGTGLSGLALRAAGFEIVDGVDLSPEMLDKARDKNAYRSLRTIGGDEPLDDLAGRYRAIAAIGVIGAGAAPPEAMDRIIALLTPGDLFVFSFNDHALADQSFTGKLNEYLDSGAARLLFSEYGDHLPGIGLKSRVYVIEKT